MNPKRNSPEYLRKYGYQDSRGTVTSGEAWADQPANGPVKWTERFYRGVRCSTGSVRLFNSLGLAMWMHD